MYGRKHFPNVGQLEQTKKNLVRIMPFAGTRKGIYYDTSRGQMPYLIPPFTYTSQTPSRNASRITRYPAIIATNGNRMTIETPRYNEFDYQSSAIGYNAAPTTTLNDISYNMCMRDFAADTATRVRRLVGVVGSRVSIAELGHKAIDSGVVGSVRVCA